MLKKITIAITIIIFPAILFAGNRDIYVDINVAGIPPEFILFGLMLIAIAAFPKRGIPVAAIGLFSIILIKAGFQHFEILPHLKNESTELLNLLGLLLGFAILARLFEDSHVPKMIPKLLPHDWRGPFVLLIFVFVLSSFLDNIAAALIGGSIAYVVFRKKVHIGYIAAIVAASNAGGAGSVIGDTTTTMMWVSGIQPLKVLTAYIAAVPALIFLGVLAAKAQQKYHPMLKGSYSNPPIDVRKLIICFMVLSGAVLANFLFDLPSIGIWAAILIGALITRIEWEELQKAAPGAIFLLLQMIAASLMPVEKLPPSSWQSAFALGFISSVFNNIPLTKLALEQGGYDWGALAYCVGFGGSMIWFGSSAGVAICGIFPEAKSVIKWVKYGWYVIAAYIIGFAVFMLLNGWHP